MKKIISIVLVLSLLQMLFINVFSAELSNTADGKLSLENESLVLEVDTTSGGISVTDKKSGEIYTSSPKEEISGLERLPSVSVVAISVLEDNTEPKKVYSYLECVTKGTVKYSKSGDTLKAVYDFKKYGVEVPIAFSLSGNCLSVSVEVAEIKDKNSYLLDIALMPYFGAAKTDQDGYLLIPDGSGTVMKFSNEQSVSSVTKYSVYGTDAMENKEFKEADVRSLNLPMYAFCYGENRSLTAFIKSGEALATLNVSPSSKSNIYNSAYFTFNYRPYTLTTLLDRTSKAQKLYIASSERVKTENYSLSYRFASGEKAGLSGIAEYVSAEVFSGVKTQKSKTFPVFLDVYMGVYKQVYTLGIPHKTTLALTTLEECRDIADDFENPVMLLRGLDKYGAVSNKIAPKFKISSKIGDKEDYRQLCEKAEVYPLAKLTEFDKGSLSYNSIFHSSRSVTGKSIKRYNYNPATLTNEGNSLFLLRPSEILKVSEKYAKSLKNSGNGSAAPITLGNSPYTDNKRSDRQMTADTFELSLEHFKKNELGVLLENPDGYALKYADRVISLPTSSSNNRITDFDIPFIQMVVGRYLTYGSTPVNLTGDTKSAVLKCAASGSALTFCVSGGDYDDLKDTDLDRLYGADYDFIKKDAVKISNEYAKKLGGIAESYIIGYEMPEKGVSLTRFSNGMTVLVNRNTSDFTTDTGITVSAGDYILTESEGI